MFFCACWHKCIPQFQLIQNWCTERNHTPPFSAHTLYLYSKDHKLISFTWCHICVFTPSSIQNHQLSMRALTTTFWTIWSKIFFKSQMCPCRRKKSWLLYISEKYVLFIHSYKIFFEFLKVTQTWEGRILPF